MNQINDLKEKLKQSKNQIPFDRLSDERESCHESILRLKETIAEKTLEYHRSQTKQPQRSKQLNEEISELKARLNLLSAQLQQLDAQIDIAEESQSNGIEQQLISEILKKHPEAESSFLEMESRLKECRRTLDLLRDFRKELDPFYDQLKLGKEAFSATKQRRLFSLLFSRHPKALLAAHIKESAECAENILLRMKDKRDFPFLEPSLYEQIVVYFKTFIQEAHRPWNQGLYNHKFETLFRSFEKLVETLEKQEKQMQQEIETINRKIEAWIDQF